MAARCEAAAAVPVDLKLLQIIRSLVEPTRSRSEPEALARLAPARAPLTEAIPFSILLHQQVAVRAVITTRQLADRVVLVAAPLAYRTRPVVLEQSVKETLAVPAERTRLAVVVADRLLSAAPVPIRLLVMVALALQIALVVRRSHTLAVVAVVDDNHRVIRLAPAEPAAAALVVMVARERAARRI